MELEHIVRTVVGRIIREVRSGSSLGQKFDTIIQRNIEAAKKLKETAAKKRGGQNATA